MTDIELTATRHHDDHGTDEDYDESESLLVVTKGEDEHDYIDDDDPGHVSTNQTSGRTRYLHLFWNSPWLPSGPWCLPTCSCCCRRHRRHRLSTKNNINDNNNDNNQQGYGDDDDDDGDDNGGSDEQLVHTAVILDAAAVQLFKFFIVTIGLMCLVHYYAEVTDADRDETYTWNEMIWVDGNHITLDIIVFFVVGRLYIPPRKGRRRNDDDSSNTDGNDGGSSGGGTAIDSFGFIIPALLTAIGMSLAATYLPNLHHSITYYDIQCTWGWQMWFIIGIGTVPIFGTILILHIHHAYRYNHLLQKSIEVIISFIIFLYPYQNNSFFHLHHWYYGWLFGMHSNAHQIVSTATTRRTSYYSYSTDNDHHRRRRQRKNKYDKNDNGNQNDDKQKKNSMKKKKTNTISSCWWSKLIMSIFWGIYINGISIFGRDPIMTCAITLYQSQNQQCPYVMENYTIIVSTDNTTTAAAAAAAATTTSSSSSSVAAAMELLEQTMFGGSKDDGDIDCNLPP